MILRKGKSHLRQVSPSRPASDAQVHSGLWGATCPLPGPTSGDRCRYGRKEGEPAGRSDKGPRFGTWNPKLEPLDPGPPVAAPSPWPQVPGPSLVPRSSASSEPTSGPSRRVSGTPGGPLPITGPTGPPHLRCRSPPHSYLAEPRPASP